MSNLFIYVIPFIDCKIVIHNYKYNSWSSILILWLTLNAENNIFYLYISLTQMISS